MTGTTNQDEAGVPVTDSGTPLPLPLEATADALDAL